VIQRLVRNRWSNSAVHVLWNLVDFWKPEKFLPDYIRFWKVDYSVNAPSLVLCYKCCTRVVMSRMYRKVFRIDEPFDSVITSCKPVVFSSYSLGLIVNWIRQHHNPMFVALFNRQEPRLFWNKFRHRKNLVCRWYPLWYSNFRYSFYVTKRRCQCHKQDWSFFHHIAYTLQLNKKKMCSGGK